MYYKLYRRRYYIYLAIGILVVLFIFNNSTNDENTIELTRNNRRINIENYVEPEPCHNCPGENGRPVYLNVNNLSKN